MDRFANKDGLNLIKVTKDELLAKLKVNRHDHVAEYNEALEGYQLSVVEDLKDLLMLVENGGKIKTTIMFDEPKSHTEDYDTVIEMLEMSVDGEIYITMSEFRQYVQDKWNWKDQFSMTNVKYLGN